MPRPRKYEPRLRLSLPTLTVWSLRAAGIITLATNDVEVEVGGLKRRASLWHMPFWNGGSWSYFLCPNCGRKCQKLRLYDGRLTCRLCDGLGRDRGKNIESIRQKLTTMRHNRSSLEASLRRALIAKRREKLLGWPPKP